MNDNSHGRDDVCISFPSEKVSIVKQGCTLNTSLILCAVIKVELYTDELMVVYVALE
jgi:hypothetical protein